MTEKQQPQTDKVTSDRLRTTVALLFMLIIVTLVAFVYAFFQQAEATKQRDAAVAIQQLADKYYVELNQHKNLLIEAKMQAEKERERALECEAQMNKKR